tara:strand:- start:49 stop:942 length:894 start_codon:yes stop_codon:yes gene_type:complete
MARNTSGWEYWNSMDYGKTWHPWVDTAERNYKTKWLTDTGQFGFYPDQNYRHEGAVTSRQPLWKPGTERGYITTGAKRGKGVYRGGIQDGGLEIIDWEAYDKDPMYKGWLSDQGKEKFKTLDDIIQAEDWLIGGTKEKVARDELNALKLKLEKEATWRAEIERMQADMYPTRGNAFIQPIGQPQTPGITQADLDSAKASWQLQSQADLESARNQWRSQWETDKSNLEANWARQKSDMEGAWGIERSRFLQDLAAGGQRKVEGVHSPGYGGPSRRMGAWGSPSGAFGRGGSRIENLNL